MNPPERTPGKPKGNRPPYRRAEPTPNQVRQMLIDSYQAGERDSIAAADHRTQEGLRRRKDGSPSAVPPHPVVPQVLWAVYEPVPDGIDFENQHDRLYWYRNWLEKWKEKGLYDGGTDLIYTNPEANRDADAQDE